VAGTNEDVVFWDVRSLKKPIEVLDESHNEDITCVKFHPTDPQQLITCSVDCMVNVFNFNGKTTMKEEDVNEAVYCS